ncbi:tRNA guanosine(34) transglycosylase Tgt [Taurinivorans muris]|uniref:Queuine tRNA-ribosyltransferase n=1 Tax=Taurinivorans muris TaxID=2787751 RepID=A0ABY5Y0I7_9BACT|nr:tRNA guanosine(34) transglycosylase Tgt [Desulfovibrionaceae bacterium LT0009]
MDRSLIGNFTLQAVDNNARAGLLHTVHGVIETPIFMPVGTVGSVKAIAPDDLNALGAQIILGNTYHLYLRPNDELIARRGGLHKFIAWDKPILTDSGGFQVFSLSSLRKMTDEYVEFRSHLDGSKHIFSPEKVISIQRNLNSDIMMQLDECIGYGAPEKEALKAVQRSAAWAKRCRDAYPPHLVNEIPQSENAVGENSRGNLLFGIVQGETYPELREMSAKALMDIGMEGYAIGGLAVGEPKHKMVKIIAQLNPLLPRTKPRYLMGVGTPLDILYGIENGVDMFDCVLPTRNARNGTLYTYNGKINIKRKEFAEDESPLDEHCDCYTCRTFSKAYLRHLYASQEILSFRLNSLHNLTFFLNLVRNARKAIFEGKYKEYKAHFEKAYADENEKFLIEDE